MAKVTVTLQGTAEADARASGDRRLRLFTREAGLLRLPWVPETLSTSDAHDGVWEEVPRPGRKPLLIKTGRNLAKLAFAARLYDGGRSVAPLQKQLRALSKSKDPIVVTFSQHERGVFRMTGLAFTDTQEGSGGRPVESVADIELTEDSDAAPVLCPVPRGKASNMAVRV